MALAGGEKITTIYNFGFTREPLLAEYESNLLSTRRARRFRNFSLSALLLCGWLAWNYSTVSKDVVGTGFDHPGKGCQGRRTKLIDIKDFNWTSIDPSENLIWVKCYEKFECARLSVPLDYANPAGERAAVALAKLPSKIPPGQEGYRGPVLFNPGGPGGSGLSLILRSADKLRTILGDDYDLIGFDPRGVGFTTPAFSVFLSNSEKGAWNLQTRLSMNATKDALGFQYGLARNLGQLAEERTRPSAEHMSTPVVARDMLSIVKAHGRDKLLYWGFSYGTVLGATYAAMFPDNIERLIIDGVEDAEDYYAALWSNNLRDTDAVLLDIYKSCVDAGPELCPLHETSTALVEERVNKIIDGLKIAPIPFYNSDDGSYDVVDSSVVRATILRTLYNPHKAGRNLTVALAELEKGNAQPIWRLSDGIRKRELLACECPAAPSVSFGQGYEHTIAIACGDGDVVQGGISELRDHFAKMAKTSPFADIWQLRISCSGWTIKAKEKILGKAIFAEKTSHPLLLIGNTADPVTPLWNAHKMSKAFNQSVVLTQNSPGHCTAAATSLCSTKYIRAYFRNGTLPPAGTVCEVESSVFGDGLNIDVQALSVEDQALLQASRELQEDYFIPMHV